jgi:hypothetical protein
MFDITVPSPVTTTARYLMSSLGTVLVTLGVLTDSTWQTVTGLVTALLPVGYAIYKQIALRRGA